MTTDGDLPDFDSECFYIAPIGARDSEVRKRSDGVLAEIVTPAAEAVGLVAVRADRISRSGKITHQILEHITKAKLAIADLTGLNVNVLYELGVRHTIIDRPVILIAQTDESLPFDLFGERTIYFDAGALSEAQGARDEIIRQAQAALAGDHQSPVHGAVHLAELKAGGDLGELIVGLAEWVGQLSMKVDEVLARQIHRKDLDLFLLSMRSELARATAHETHETHERELAMADRFYDEVHDYEPDHEPDYEPDYISPD